MLGTTEGRDMPRPKGRGARTGRGGRDGGGGRGAVLPLALFRSMFEALRAPTVRTCGASGAVGRHQREEEEGSTLKRWL